MSKPITVQARAPHRFCSGSILRHTLIMAGTGTLGLLAIFIVDLLNFFYISRLHDPSLTAAIAFIGAVNYLQMSVSIGMSIGLGAVVSRRIGARRLDEARRIASASLAVMSVVMLLIGLATTLAIGPVLSALGATGEVRAAAARNLSIISPFVFLIAFGMGCSSLLRSVGDARRSMTVTLWSAALVAGLDPILIFFLHLGLMGAAISTVLSRALAAGLGLAAVSRHHQILGRPALRHLFADIRPVACVALPAILTNLATPAGGAFVTHTMAGFGLEAVSGAATIDRIVPVAFAFIFALTGSLGPIMGQNLGAAQVGRVRQTLTCALALVLGCVLVMWALLAALQDPLIRLFAAQGSAAMLLHLFCSWLVAAFLFVGALFVANTAFNNLGAPLLSTVFNWGRATLGTVPFVLAGRQFGPRGVLIGQALGSVLFGTLAVVAAFLLVRRLPAARPEATEVSSQLTVPGPGGKAAMAEIAES